MSHKPKTVLIVDDDEGTRDTLTAILKREYRVLRVSSGEAALPVLNREDVDLMLLDVRLPGISGQGELQPGRGHHDLGHQ
jgi:DNA-binding response OmpR family regulator